MPLAVSLAVGACGGKGANAGGEKRLDIDADPLALLPASPLVVAKVDARAVFDSGAAGAQVAAVADKLVPIGEKAGFRATRDVDQVVFASYATGGADFAAVLSGRFDQSKIAAATTSTDGAPIVRGLYAGQTTYTARAMKFAPLTPKTMVAGSGDGLRRLLERVSSGKLDRSMPVWMAETVEAKGVEIAVAADFDAQPIASAAIGSVNLPWLNGMHMARVVGDFAPPGMNVAATLTYGDPQQTQTAADGVRAADALLRMLGPLLGGVRLQQFEVKTDANDLRFTFAVDQECLRAVLALAPRFLPMTP